MNAGRKGSGAPEEKLVSALEEICGVDRVSTDNRLRDTYGRDKITEQHYAGRSGVIAWPTTTAEVVQIVQCARERGVAVTPRDGGSGLSGGAVPVEGCIVIAMERMNRVLEVDDENLVAVVSPGWSPKC